MFGADEAMMRALAAARDGLAAGEMPIGAVVFDGERVLGRAYTQEKTLADGLSTPISSRCWRPTRRWASPSRSAA